MEISKVVHAGSCEAPRAAEEGKAQRGSRSRGAEGFFSFGALDSPFRRRTEEEALMQGTPESEDGEKRDRSNPADQESTEVERAVGESAHANTAQTVPPLPLGGPTSSAWREDSLTKARELEALTTWVRARQGASGARREEDGDGLMDAIWEHVARARRTAEEKRLWWRPRWMYGGSRFERTLGNLDAAEANLLRLAPSDYLRGLMPSLTAHINRYLPKDDPRRIGFDSLASDMEADKSEMEAAKSVSERKRSTVVAAFHAANSQRRREFLRVRSFRNVLLVAASLLLLAAVGLGVIGSLRSEMIPLCFHPDEAMIVCPTQETPTPDSADTDEVIRETVSAWDIWLVELLGLVAAALAGAFALRGLRGTSVPYSLPVALAILKLPTGALTAVLGILLMRGGFVPGLTALDTPAQILSWAVIFGYAQQLFTRFVDQQGYAVLDSVRGRGAAGDREVEQSAAG